MKNKILPSSVALVALAVTPLSSHGVTLLDPLNTWYQGESNPAVAPNQSSTVTNYSFTTEAATDSVLFFGLTMEGFTGINSLTFDGDAAQQLVVSGTTGRQVAIYGFDLGDTAGTTADVTLDVGAQFNNQNGGVWLFQVEGADFAGLTSNLATQTDSGFDDPDTQEFTNAPQDSLLASFAITNDGMMKTITGTGFDGTDLESGNSSEYIAGVEQISTGPGTIGGTFDSNDPTGDLAMASFYVAPIPEPSTFAMIGGLSVLGLAVLRRRK